MALVGGRREARTTIAQGHLEPGDLPSLQADIADVRVIQHFDAAAGEQPVDCDLVNLGMNRERFGRIVRRGVAAQLGDLPQQFAGEATDHFNAVVRTALDRIKGVDHRRGQNAATVAVALQQQRARARPRGGARGRNTGTAGARDEHVVVLSVEWTEDHGDSVGVVPAATGDCAWRLPAQSSAST